MISFLEECKNAKSIAISGHVRPDGDCIGSCLALAMYLRQKMSDCAVDVLLEEPSDIFDVIAQVDSVISVDLDKTYDVFIALDCDYTRLGFSQNAYLTAGKTINIDHHVTNKALANVNHIRPEVGSTAELIFELLGEDAIDDEIAKALYIGIIHDTGVMQYSNTRPRTLEIAAKLITYNFDFSKIIEETFYQKNFKQTQVLGRVLLDSKRYLDDKCIIGCVSIETMNEYKARPQTLDGAVNKLKQVRGVECAALIYELEKGVSKVSLRSDNIDVSQICAFFGGGGHKQAAGFTWEGTQDDIVAKLLVKVDEYITCL